MIENASDPTQRFSGRAVQYARCRPDYPLAALDFLLDRCCLRPGATVVDVGAGTGISSRLLAERGLRVIGIEPNDDMRRQALAVSGPAGFETPRYVTGLGEATGLEDGCADAVVCAQAFHWLRAEEALREFHRILKPADVRDPTGHSGGEPGWAALIWNERDETDPFTAAYGEIVRSFPHAHRIEGRRLKAGQALLEAPQFTEARVDWFAHDQRLGQQETIDRAFSASYAPAEPRKRAQAEDAFREVFRRFATEEYVSLRYRTSVYTARKRATGMDRKPTGKRGYA